MKWLLIAASLLLGIGAAGAQVPLPQNVPVPAVPSGLDASGNFTQRLVNFTDLNFGTIYGAQAISTSANTAQWGSAVYVLDADPGYQVNTALQGACLDDGISFVMGFVTALDSSSGSTVLTLDVVIAQGGSPCSNWFFQVINGVTNGVPPTQAIALSTTSFAIPVAGATQSFTVDANKGYSAGSLIFVAALGNSSAWFWMIVQNYNTSTGVVNGFVVQSSQLNSSSPGIFMALGPGALRLSGSAKVYANWAVGMSSTLAPFVSILGFSGTSLTYGSGASQIKQGGVVTMTTQTGLLLNNSHIVVSSSTDSTKYFRGIGQYNSSTGALTVYITDASGSGTIASWSLFAQDGPPVNADQIAVSTSSATLGAGDFTFTIQAGQNLPIQGPVTLTALANPLNQMLGTIKAYSGTSLIVTVPSTGVYGSGTFTAWSILNTGPPQTRISLYQMNGLKVTGTAAVGFTVQAGSVQDSTGTIDLTLAASETATVVGTSARTGTATLAAGVVTGSGTAFSSDFSAAGTLADLNNQLTNLGYPNVTAGVIFGVATNTAVVTSVASNTSLTLNIGFTAGSSSIYRGLPPGGSIGNFPQTWGIIIARQDSTGTCHTFQVSFTPSGAPDLPSGYTYYRVIAYSTMGGPAATVNIIQPLLASRSPQAPTAVFSATITPTAVGITEASLNTTTGLITLNAATLGSTPVVTGQSVVLTGTVSTGLTTGQAYYINVQTPGSVIVGATFYLYTDLADCYAGGLTGRVIPSVNNNAGWSFRYFAYTNVLNYGFDANAPIAGAPGSATMHWDFNLANAIASTSALRLDCNAAGLKDSTPTQSNFWKFGAQAGSSTLYSASTTTLITYSGNALSVSTNLNQGTWAQQGTNFWTMECTVWGQLDEPIPANDNDLILRAVA